MYNIISLGFSKLYYFYDIVFLLLKTFRPRKRFEPGTMKFNLHKQANASLNSGIDLKDVVRLPQGEDSNDWIAVHGENTTFIIHGPVWWRGFGFLFQCLSFFPGRVSLHQVIVEIK